MLLLLLLYALEKMTNPIQKKKKKRQIKGVTRMLWLLWLDENNTIFFFFNFTKYLSVILKIFKMHILKIKHFKIAYPNKNIGDSSILPLFF